MVMQVVLLVKVRQEIYQLHVCIYSIIHRRRIDLEDKAKVVASDWGTESLPR